ncbi:COQ9 family protein [Thalassorhabdomicrobium marinisediminis]|uniref:COQ9 family protein n=1 Tax=Thalassorhabdomicrobium marinisediminis TaxID=2170577 RepID=A0A2T7FYP2_9RHOB|nr:COQ9 family protein [Thalassorhabdomicrobium marinisediminis]PVA07287.1 COQ9 family protein [Thalassorhabdomicrobium marinisediminis]
MSATLTPETEALLDAILPHVAFDGWSSDAFTAAARDAGMSLDHAHAICPRGATDLAILFHRRGDSAMVSALQTADLDGMRFRDKVAYAVRTRLDVITDKEAVRRGMTLFALPHLAPEGSKLIWDTADAIWTALGDRSDDVNWYTKRATLSAVWGSVVLFWLGDNSPATANTTAFIDRRIDNVMQFEKVKSAVAKNPLTKPFAQALGALTAPIKPPSDRPRDVPGKWDLPS